jgi:acyl-coenzyme A thioesterase PaaI-like protein
LALLAAGAFTTRAVAAGWQRVRALGRAMHDGRRRRLGRLGFTDDEADELSALHTRNFMRSPC